MGSDNSGQLNRNAHCCTNSVNKRTFIHESKRLVAGAHRCANWRSCWHVVKVEIFVPVFLADGHGVLPARYRAHRGRSSSIHRATAWVWFLLIAIGLFGVRKEKLN